MIYLLIFFFVNNAFGQRSERIGYVNMEYILSQMEDYKTASAQLEEKINLSKGSSLTSHYKMSPYTFQPKESKKLVPKNFIDIGQGVLEIIHEMNEQKNL